MSSILELITQRLRDEQQHEDVITSEPLPALEGVRKHPCVRFTLANNPKHSVEIEASLTVNPYITVIFKEVGARRRYHASSLKMYIASSLDGEGPPAVSEDPATTLPRQVMTWLRDHEFPFNSQTLSPARGVDLLTPLEK